MRNAAVVALVLACGLLMGCEGRQRPSLKKSGESHDEPRGGPAVLVLDVSGGLPEQAPTGLLGFPSKNPSFDELVREIERLDREKSVRGVLVRIGAVRLGLARASETGDLLEALGKKFPVWCHADELSNETTYLAARGCKRVWLSPGGTMDTIGLAAQLVYFHKLLTDQLGLEVDFLQVGKYKGAEEPFTRDGPSPEARASLESTLAGTRMAWLEGLQKGRPQVSPEAFEDGPYSAEGARARGLIDDIGYFDQTRDALEKLTDAGRSEVRFGAGLQSSGGDELSDLLRALAGESIGTAPIALVRATGAISMEGGGGLLKDSGGIAERRLVRTLTRLEKDDSVKAVVFRIDSPGGSALASDLLWHALMRLRGKKPLVVSVGGMAASGGYYLASSGAVIFADKTSIVGSIGVVGGKVAVDHALEKIGIHTETIPGKAGDRRAGSRAAYESLLEPWDEPTRARLLETMTAIYQLFLARIAEGRSIPIERVALSAEGRIFSGQEAKDRGLVDELGGLQDAVARARTMAGLPADARVAVAGEASGLLESLSDDEGRVQGSQDAHLSPLLPLAGGIAPELLPFIASLAPIVEREVALCALPFALTVR